MTPRDFDPTVVQTRLRLLSELLEDLENAGEVTAERLTADRMHRHAIERVLTQLVELAVSVNGHVIATRLGKAPKDYRDSFRLAAEAGIINPTLMARLQPSVGLRNVLAHEYVEVDLEVVASSTRKALTEYREYVRSVSVWLTEV